MNHKSDFHWACPSGISSISTGHVSVGSVRFPLGMSQSDSTGHVSVGSVRFPLGMSQWDQSDFHWACLSGISPISTGHVPVGSQLVCYRSATGPRHTSPALRRARERGKPRLSRFSTGDSRYSPRDKPGGEQKKVMLEMILTVPHVAGQLSLPLGQAQRKWARWFGPSARQPLITSQKLSETRRIPRTHRSSASAPALQLDLASFRFSIILRP